MGKKGKYNNRNDEDEGKKKNFIITEEHLMDKTHMDPAEFIPYLERDSLYPPYMPTKGQESTLRYILKQLNYVLYLEFKSFWATILYNPSFKICIHTCIQYFPRKWLNDHSHESIEEVTASREKIMETLKYSPEFEYTQHLMRIVLLIYYRIMHFNEENAELSNLYHIKSEIVGKYILDVPRLLEIIEVYGATNEHIVKIIVKNFTNLSTTLYSDFTEEVMQPMVARLGKNLNIIKRTTDREQFGINYNYTRTIAGQLSPGQLQLQKKVKLLMQIISFYETLQNISTYFPSTWAEYTRFNLQIHSMSQNTFIEIEQAYKVWSHHGHRHKLYPLLNRILEYIVEYFVAFFRQCEGIFVQKNIKSSFKEAYMKCLDRVIENYGRRVSLGKKAGSTKRYMELYREILKIYKLDDFLSKLYVQQVENSTYGMNVQYLIDFKIAIDETNAKLQGRPLQIPPQINDNEQATQADANDIHENMINQIQKHPQRKASIQDKKQQRKQVELDQLEILISKKQREEGYYEKLHRNFRTKMVIQYDDQYDDLVDYEKRPMFQDNEKEEQDSSDDSSGQEFDSQMEKLHLVKSDSNVERARGAGTLHHAHQKYDRKNKVQYVSVRQAQANAILKKQANRQQAQTNQQKPKPTYQSKQEESEKEKVKQRPQGKNKEYNDEDCYQECRTKFKEDKKQFKKKEQEERKNGVVEVDYSDDEDDGRRQEGQARQGGQGGRGGGGGYRGGRGGGGRGGRGGRNQYNKEKGENTNKKKYTAKI